MNSILATRNRHALILLDSTLEIAFKEFLVYVVGIKDLDPSHVEHRDVLHRIVKRHTDFNKDVWDSIGFFYERRCDLYHEDAASTLSDEMIFDFFNLVIWTVDRLFGTEVQGSIQSPEELLKVTERILIDVNAVKSKIDAVVVAVDGRRFAGSRDISHELKRLGYKKGLTPGQISSLMSNKSYRHLFHTDASVGGTGLSEAGTRRYKEIRDGVGGRNEL
jgi:hypothetical protein